MLDLPHGVVLLGLAALNTAGITGAVMQMVAHGLVAGALFLLVGLLQQRTHTRDIGEYSSLVRAMPRFAFFMVLALTAAIGLPGTAGFIAELHALVGGFARWGGWMLLLSLSLLISAAYAFRTVGRLFTGPVGASMRAVPDLTRAEMAAAGLLSACILALGVYPAPALALIGPSVARRWKEQASHASEGRIPMNKGLRSRSAAPSTGKYGGKPWPICANQERLPTLMLSNSR